MFFPDAKMKGRRSRMEAVIMEKLKILAESAKFDVSVWIVDRTGRTTAG